ncbi:hypothetical protein Goshw_010597 [Gossypium schwendimanii]|uniref:Uncharacterized protein n=1 Tax=Gossypium schwendimanii TaxID=34291 RepID=A0A7J9NCG6_GOSSC|nr:hypothetical protein [Gossypium schwendimanii]
MILGYTSTSKKKKEII